MLFCCLEENSRKHDRIRKLKKNHKSSQNESIQISLCFSHYKHHTDMKQSNTATNPSPSQQNAMNRHSEEGPRIMKKRGSICVSKYVQSYLNQHF